MRADRPCSSSKAGSGGGSLCLLDDAELEIEVWKQALALQQHINDILFRLRSFFFLFLAAAATFGSKGSFSGVLDFPSNLVLLTPAVAVYLLDRFYYHLLLVGAVEAARRVEAKRPVLRLSETLRDLSRAARCSCSSDADGKRSRCSTAFQ